MVSPVFYRKWRPRTFADVVGQEHITRTLLNAVRRGQVSHAYLFCGPRGTGKTSTGRILAKAINCLENNEGEPCNHCSSCQAINEGQALDIIEIDAATNTGVDNIRELIERTNYAPALAKYKVYIIDEVHMLSNSASSALLKTLEEPPPQVVFVLATTEVHKVLPTVISRCQRFDFRRLGQKDVTRKLNEISASEGIKIDEASLALIAQNSSGSLRDAENLLQQLVTYYGKEISAPQVKEMLGITDEARVKELARAVVGKDITGGIKVVNALVQEGFDLRQFHRQFISYLHNLLLVKSNCEEDVPATKEDLDELRELANKTTLADIVAATKIFNKAGLEIDSVSSLPLELALIETTLPAKVEIKSKAEKENQTERVPEAKTPTRESKAPSSEGSKSKTQEPPISGKSDLEKLQLNWKQVIERAPAELKRSAVSAIMRSAGVKPVAIEDDTVVLSFKFAYHKEKIEEPENNKVASELISHFLGHSYQVKCIYEAEENHLVLEAQKLGARLINVEDK